MTGNPALHKCTTLVSALVCPLLPAILISLPFYLFTGSSAGTVRLLFPVSVDSPTVTLRLLPLGLLSFVFSGLSQLSLALFHPHSLSLLASSRVIVPLHLKVGLKTSHVHSLALHPDRVVLTIYWRGWSSSLARAYARARRVQGLTCTHVYAPTNSRVTRASAC